MAHEHAVAAAECCAHTGAERSDVRAIARDGGLEIRARAGEFTVLSVLALIASLIWGVAWSVHLAKMIQMLQAGGAPSDAGSKIFVEAILAFFGLYCGALLFYSMAGHERLILTSGRLRLSNPWLFGAMGKRQPLPNQFDCQGADCKSHSESHGDGCCCSYSTVDYTLGFTSGGRRTTAFNNLPNEAKDWIRDRLNAELSKPRG